MPDLDGLLDEALDGFKDADATSAAASTSTSASVPVGLAFDPLGKPKASKGRKPHQLSQEGADLLKLKPDELAKDMANLMREMSEATTGEAHPQPGGEEAKVLDLAATLSSLGEKTRATAGPELVPDEVNDAMLGKLTEELQSLQDSPEVQSLIDSLMQQLLSKEVLYQPMKDIAGKYPEWLQKNKGTLSGEDFAKYSKQHEDILNVCAIYEGESVDYDKLIVAMQAVQACGQPPQEIVSELAPGLQFDGSGLPAFPQVPGGSPDQCSIQ